MSNTTSGGISFSGLGSGVDTDSIIASLKQAQEIPKNRYSLTQAEYEYRISALEEKQLQLHYIAINKFLTLKKLLLIIPIMMKLLPILIKA